MRRLIIGLIVLLAATLMAAGPASAQAGPEFRLGFKVLADLIPGGVGEPLENERHNVANGDGLQRTTRGLMVWRKADNFTAFTDGTTTWVNGPFGLQIRPNNVRFEWERPSAPSSLPEGAVSLTFSRAPGGGWVGQGTVQNRAGETMDVEINVIALSSPGGVPLIDAPTVFVPGLAPGESQQVIVPVPYTGDVGAWRQLVQSQPISVRENLSADVGTTRPLDVDSTLAGAVAELRKVDDGEWLVRVAAEQGVRARDAFTPDGILGDFDLIRNRVTVSSQLNSSSAWVRAAVLAHEFQHAAGIAAGELPTTSAQCFQFETDAFLRQSVVWTELWQGNLPPDVDSIHAELNDIALTVAHNPEAFAVELVQRYRAECGTLP